jgi:hypothetical protein
VDHAPPSQDGAIGLAFAWRNCVAVGHPPPNGFAWSPSMRRLSYEFVIEFLPWLLRALTVIAVALGLAV